MGANAASCECTRGGRDSEGDAIDRKKTYWETKRDQDFGAGTSSRQPWGCVGCYSGSRSERSHARGKHATHRRRDSRDRSLKSPPLASRSDNSAGALALSRSRNMRLEHQFSSSADREGSDRFVVSPRNQGMQTPVRQGSSASEADSISASDPFRLDSKQPTVPKSEDFATAPPPQPAQPRIFSDHFNWVDPKAVLAWSITVINMRTKEKEQLYVYNNDTIDKVKAAFAKSTGCEPGVRLFRVQGLVCRELQNRWELRQCVQNKATLVAYHGDLAVLLERNKQAIDTATRITAIPRRPEHSTSVSMSSRDSTVTDGSMAPMSVDEAPSAPSSGATPLGMRVAREIGLAA